MHECMNGTTSISGTNEFHTQTQITPFCLRSNELEPDQHQLSTTLLNIVFNSSLHCELAGSRDSCPSVPMSDRRKQDRDLEILAKNIERSRKRHLAVGLLRGDRVQDQLTEQEASASPVLKKTKIVADPITPPESDTPEVPAMALTMAEFTKYMDANTNKNIADMKGILSSVEKATKENSSKLEQHDEIIKRNQEQIAEIRDEVFKMKAAPAASNVRSYSEVMRSPASSAKQDKDYDVARRSLRLWPVSGLTSDGYWEAAGVFLGRNLGLEGKIDRSKIQSIDRVKIPSGPTVRDEVLIVFTDAEARDLVIGAAAKLAPFVDSQGRSTAGIRMEVPGHLQHEFRALYKYGQGVRTRHGPGTRRHVKFNDVDRNLFLNVKLPGDEQWTRVSGEVAKRGLRARDVASESEMEKRFDFTGAPASARARSTSLSNNNQTQATAGSAWGQRRASASEMSS